MSTHNVLNYFRQVFHFKSAAGRLIYKCNVGKIHDILNFWEINLQLSNKWIKYKNDRSKSQKPPRGICLYELFKTMTLSYFLLDDNGNELS